MASSEIAITNRTEMARSPSFESLAEIGGIFALRTLADDIETLSDIQDLESRMLGAEVATRLSETGVRSPFEALHNPYRVSAPADTPEHPELIALPFASTAISRYHEMWRLISTRLIGEEWHSVHDWVVDLRTGYCVVSQVVYCDDDPLDSNSEPRVTLAPDEIAIIEGAEYRKYMQSLSEKEMAFHSDRSGFMQDTQVFVGGEALAIDMHDPKGFVHDLIS